MYDDRQEELQDWRRPLTARTLVLAFLSTSRDRPMRTAALIRRAEICGIDGPAVRMALGRLVREARVVQPERGSYTIGPAGRALDDLARGWADAEARVRPWHGRWIVVAADHLGRGDRRLRRTRERALRLGGFAQAPDGLWVRPDNLALPVAAMAARLHAWGLDAAATILGDADALDDGALRDLWPVTAIEASYHRWVAEMAASERRVATVPLLDAARETLLLGQSVIRAINVDPLLPAEMIDGQARATMIAAMRHYDAVGKAFWSRID